MAGVGSKVRPARDPDETEESGGEEPSVAASNSGKWAEKSLPLPSTSEKPNTAKETSDKGEAKSVVEAFGEVSFLPNASPEQCNTCVGVAIIWGQCHLRVELCLWREKLCRPVRKQHGRGQQLSSDVESRA